MKNENIQEVRQSNTQTQRQAGFTAPILFMQRSHLVDKLEEGRKIRLEERRMKETPPSFLCCSLFYFHVALPFLSFFSEMRVCSQETRRYVLTHEYVIHKCFFSHT